MMDRMKHRFVENLGEWFQLLWEMGVITKKELDEVLDRVADDEPDDHP
jgi:hypothetical protein